MDKKRLVESLKKRKISKEILRAFSEVRREDFVPDDMKYLAYEDEALPIGKGQTISQPYTIALMLSSLELKKGQKVLEVGSGCGYVLALLSKIVGENGRVFGVEIIHELAEKSRKNLKEYENIKVHIGDGKVGIPEEAPFDEIIISAGYKEIPKLLIGQLKEKGIIVAPVGGRYGQSLISYKKINGKLQIQKEIPGFIFVPLVD